MPGLVADPLPEDPGGLQDGQLVLDGVVHADADSLEQPMLRNHPAVLALQEGVLASQAGIGSRCGHPPERVHPIVPHELEQRVGQGAGQLRIGADDHGGSDLAAGELLMMAERPEPLHQDLGGGVEHPREDPTADHERMRLANLVAEVVPVVVDGAQVRGPAGMAGPARPECQRMQTHQLMRQARGREDFLDKRVHFSATLGGGADAEDLRLHGSLLSRTCPPPAARSVSAVHHRQRDLPCDASGEPVRPGARGGQAIA
jgi:hypothetical protein